MIEIILGGCLAVSIIAIVILSTRKQPISELLALNLKLRSENDDLKIKLEHSEKRRKNILSINKGERAMIEYPLVFDQGKKDEVSFNAFLEVDVIEVTDKKIKVIPYKVITDNNDINSDQSKLANIMEFIKNKWFNISDAQPIIDTQVRREDKLEELTNSK